MPQLTTEQNEGVRIILNAFKIYKGFLLADRMGFGKTAQAIEVSKYALKSKLPILIICPAYLVYNWLDELELWRVKQKTWIIDSGKQILDEALIYIASYNLVSSDGIFKQLCKKEFSLIVCDEGHYLKSWNSKRSRRILGTKQTKHNYLLNKTKKMLLLTGTPILNNIEELYNIIIRIAPDTLNKSDKLTFIMHFARFIEYTKWGIVHRGVKNEGQLRNLIKPVFLARKKIIGLKDRHDKHIKLQLKGHELTNFIRQENEFLAEHGIDANEITGLQKLTKLDVAKISEIRQRVALFKIPFFMQGLADTREKTEGPILIYCYHISTQMTLLQEIRKKYKYIAYINGSVPMSKRHNIIEDYKGGKIDILVATIGALREGVNLVTGNVVKFLELDWTPANIEQAVARLWRKGQNKEVFVYFYYFNNGIDKHIIKLLKQKSTIIQKIVG